MATPKDKLNKLLDVLDESQIFEVVNFAEFLATKKQNSFWDNLPIDDEPLTKTDIKAIKSASREKTLSYKEVFGNND